MASPQSLGIQREALQARLLEVTAEIAANAGIANPLETFTFLNGREPSFDQISNRDEFLLRFVELVAGALAKRK